MEKQLLLTIDGAIPMAFYELNGIQPVSPEREADIQKNLTEGNYSLNLEAQQVDSLPNLEPVAAFKLQPDDGVEYSFQLV